MKRKCAIILLSMLVGSTMLGGCGTSTAKTESVTENVTTIVSNDSASEEVTEQEESIDVGQDTEVEETTDNAEIANAAATDIAQEASAQAAENGAIIIPEYPAAEEWETAKITEPMMQINDILLKEGQPLSDIMDTVATSEMNFDYEYNPDKLTQYNKSYVITVLYNGIEWFDVEYQNPDRDATISAKDSVVCRIRPYQDAIPYIRFLDGKTFADLQALSYDELEALFDTYSEFYSYQEPDVIGSDNIYIRLKNAASPEGQVYGFPYSQWSGYYILPYTNTDFIVDANTGHLIEIKFNDTHASFTALDDPLLSIYLEKQNSEASHD